MSERFWFLRVITLVCISFMVIPLTYGQSPADSALSPAPGVKGMNDELQRFKYRRQISIEEWTIYRDEVKAMPTVKAKATTNETMYGLEQKASTLSGIRSILEKPVFYQFTEPGNPAHPAVITTYLISKPGEKPVVANVGHYAGSESAYEAWLSQMIQRMSGAMQMQRPASAASAN
jgi:hypothetical protein